MAVNKANYKNMKAQNALNQVQIGVIPESAAVGPVNAAASANNNVAEELKNIREAGAQPPPLPPKPTRRAPNNTAGKFLNSLGNNPSANNLNKVRYIANENVVTNQVRSRARAILLKALLDSYNGKNNRWYANQNLNSLQSQLSSATRNLTLNKNTFNRLNIIRGRIKNAKQGRPANQRQLAIRQTNQIPQENSNKSVKILRTYLANHKSDNAANAQIEFITRYKAAANGKMNNALRTNVNARLNHLRGLQNSKQGRPSSQGN
jgi:hypothetical protein